MPWIIHEPDDLLTALDRGELALYPVTVQWQREAEALRRGQEVERERRKQKKKAS